MNKETGNTLLENVESLINNMGFSVVEVNSSTNRNRFKINIIIFNGNGVNIDDCTKIHKTIFPRLEIIYDKFDLYLEISSPGIERIFKDAREFSVFLGKSVKIMYGSSNEWESGIIEAVDIDSVDIRFSGDCIKIKYNDICKCKLDYIKEVRKI